MVGQSFSAKVLEVKKTNFFNNMIKIRGRNSKTLTPFVFVFFYVLFSEARRSGTDLLNKLNVKAGTKKEWIHSRIS
jgi:hypothetical protein